MKVLNLLCAHRHAFEGWFASEDDFQSQLGRGLVECPICGDGAITKGLTAPRLNLGAEPPRASPPRSAQPGQGQVQGQASAKAQELIAAHPELEAQFLKAVREVMANTEDVGERFAEEARRIHYGEVEERGIRGQATREETQELLEEGIAVMALPIPKALKGPIQ